jgi:hypothetical protein
MTVYVDDARIPAKVGRISARWSHLFADTQEELHEFAASIGLRRAWFQPGKPLGGRPSRHWHYDVTDSKREQAIRDGARPIGIREYREIVARRDTPVFTVAELAAVTDPVAAALAALGPPFLDRHGRTGETQ